jgi:microcompartment protein CcmK/EutM
MKLARVLGHVVATCKHPAYRGERLMIVQPVNEHGEKDGQSLLAVDSAQSGPGDLVLVMREGTGVRQILGKGPNVPIRSLIVGIVDHVECDDRSP